MLNLKEYVVERDFAGKKLSLKSGMIAKQAAGAVFVQYGETVVFSAVTVGDPREGVEDFFPLTVDYREKMYAAGKFPGGFFKRESRPSDRETLVMRLTDRPMRPLFPKGFTNEVVISSMVLSSDGQNHADVLSMVGSAAAVCISEIPFYGAMAGVRVGRIGGQFVANPTMEQMEKSDLNLVIAGTKDAITMVEAGANEMPESDMIDALDFGHGLIRQICDMIEELVRLCGKPKMAFVPKSHDAIVKDFVARALPRLKPALLTPGKSARRDAAKAVRNAVIAEMAKPEEQGGPTEATLKGLWEEVMAAAIRGMILDENKRVDGRTCTDIRPIDCRVNVLPRTHGAALFTRGETQALVTCTLGTKGDEQSIEGLFENRGERFYLHYNFPGFSVGEAKLPRGPGRREIGHGALAQRALTPLVPAAEKFPYTVRLVSDIMESNGSSSMASVCGGTLAMMDAGVPMERPVAGIAMGLIKEGDRVGILSDILGDEDHFGDMDFKVCGSAQGITALQMDIKCTGLSRAIMQKALEQARVGRLHILECMKQAIATPRADISPYAPRIHTLMVDPELLGKLIGPGGKTVRGIQEKSGAKIDIDDSGAVMIASADGAGLKMAISLVEAIVKVPEVGDEFVGKVVSIRDFGAFVEIAPGVDGLVHVSELAHGYVKTVGEVCKMGDTFNVKIIGIDEQGRIKLSRKALLPKPEGTDSKSEKKS